MAGNIETRIINYLKKQESANTFELARKLDIDRHKILDVIKELEEEKAIEFRSGVAKFLEFPVKEKAVKKIKIKKVPSKPKRAPQKKAIPKRNVIERIQSKWISEGLQELEEITRKQSSTKNDFREQAERIKKLEKTVEELQQKVDVSLKVPVEIKEEAKPIEPEVAEKEVERVAKKAVRKKFKNHIIKHAGKVKKHATKIKGHSLKVKGKIKGLIKKTKKPKLIKKLIPKKSKKKTRRKIRRKFKKPKLKFPVKLKKPGVIKTKNAIRKLFKKLKKQK